MDTFPFRGIKGRHLATCASAAKIAIMKTRRRMMLDDKLFVDCLVGSFCET